MMNTIKEFIHNVLHGLMVACAVAVYVIFLTFITWLIIVTWNLI